MAAIGAFNGMTLGLLETPYETYRAVRASQSSSGQQTARRGEPSDSGSVSKTLLAQEQDHAGSSIRDPNARSRPPDAPSQSNLSRSTSDIRRSSISGTKPKIDQDMLRQTAPHSSRGIGRLFGTIARSPMDISVALTQGVHNVPKMWGDTTIRPQERVTDFSSGMKAVGRGNETSERKLTSTNSTAEFAFGWYDGLGGLVTQPMQGYKKSGGSGLAIGIGKGIAGLGPKLLSACLGVVSHPMKGIHEEVLKRFGNNVQSHIIASRVTQGYDEWLQSSDEERKDVIDRWKSIEHLLKRGRTKTDEQIDKVLRSHSQNTMTRNVSRQSAHHHISTTSNEPLLEADPEEALQFQPQTRQFGGGQPNDTGSKQMLQDTPPQIQQQRPDDNMSDFSLDVEDSGYEPPRREAVVVRRKLVASVVEGGYMHETTSLEGLHLAGTTQSEFETQRQSEQREKTSQEKTEEEIVLEYVKKQSRLEADHYMKGKGRAAFTEDQEEANLTRALELSMQEHEDELRWHGEASGS